MKLKQLNCHGYHRWCVRRLPANMTVCVCVCVCVFKVEHWARSVNKCHVIFAEALCRLKKVFSVPFHNNSRRAAFSPRCIIFRRRVWVKHFRRSAHHTSVNGFNTATEMIHWETLCGVSACLNLVFCCFFFSQYLGAVNDERRIPDTSAINTRVTRVAYISTPRLELRLLFICCDVNQVFAAASLVSVLIAVGFNHSTCCEYIILF